MQNFLTELGCIPSRKICGLSRKKHKKLSRVSIEVIIPKIYLSYHVT
ncbi:MAG: hypothetical protein ACKESC_00740 [Candidatus Hodgkinia cicadicola]